MDTSKNLQPLLARQERLFREPQNTGVFEDRRKWFDAPEDEDRGLEVSIWRAPVSTGHEGYAVSGTSKNLVSFSLMWFIPAETGEQKYRSLVF